MTDERKTTCQIKQSETQSKCHCQVTSDQNQEEEWCRPRLQNPWFCWLKTSLKLWLRHTKWNNAQLILQNHSAITAIFLHYCEPARLTAAWSRLVHWSAESIRVKYQCWFFSQLVCVLAAMLGFREAILFWKTSLSALSIGKIRK